MQKVCTICHSPYHVKPFRADKSKFCSKECWSRRNPRITQNCVACNAPFSSWRSQSRKTCGVACGNTLHLRGERHPRWKGGKSQTERELQQSDIARWRKAVFTRDKYTCQHCGDKQNLNAHHVKEWADFPNDRFDVANGLTLCESCHGRVHGKDFSNRRVKHCSICFESTSGRSLYCRSCSIRLNWQTRKAV